MVDPTVTVRDQTPQSIAPIDESVLIPESVRRQARAAEAFYQAPAADAPPLQPDPPAADPPLQPDPAAALKPAAPDPAVPPPQHISDDPDAKWENRYLSMKGRFDASQRTIGNLQQQMSELGDELVHTQRLVQHPQNPGQSAPPAAAPTKLITPQDEENYGADLISTMQRAAREAIAPELTALQNQNVELKQTLARTTGTTLAAALDAAVPTWREINVSPRWKSWLRLPDVYSGRIRVDMLNEARRAADAPRVASFFAGFLREEAATGNADLAPLQPEPPAPPVPRQAAVPLSSLAAPGRARPAGGDAPVSVDKPIFTRAQIAHFYKPSTIATYVGRDDDRKRDEAAIFAAQREGRVRG